MPNVASINALSFALDSVLARQQAVASNIANADVPGYQAQRVTFERSLASAISSGGTAKSHMVPEGLASGTNANNVNLATEMSMMEKNSLENQAVVDGLNASFGMLTTAITG